MSEQTRWLPHCQPPTCSQPPEWAGSAVNPGKAVSGDVHGCGGSTGLSNEILNRQGKKREMIFPFSCQPNLQRKLFVSIAMKRSVFALGVQRRLLCGDRPPWASWTSTGGRSIPGTDFTFRYSQMHSLEFLWHLNPGHLTAADDLTATPWQHPDPS